MNTTKRINVNFSSLVGLKAELLKKQIEVKDAKEKNENFHNPAAPKVKTKRTKEKKRDREDDAVKPVDVEDIEAHKKSRLMLEAKSRLYDTLRRSRKNVNPHCLVDFANKPYESEEEQSDDAIDEVMSDDPSDPEDEWVEYEDCFGRTRKCLRRDLPMMQAKDNFVKNEIMKKPKSENDDDHIDRDAPLANVVQEPDIALMRKKWEEQMVRLSDKQDIHYQDVLFNEARTHGVGYYAFSQDEEVRAKQQENLNKLRQETKQKQKEMTELKTLKSKMEQNRLKAARIRQRIRAGLPAEPTSVELEDSQSKPSDVPEIDSAPQGETEVNQRLTDISSTSATMERTESEKTSPDSLQAVEEKVKAFGKLLNKRTWYEMSQEEWVHERREDRKKEFGPIYSNFKKGGYLENSNKVNVDESCGDESHDGISNEPEMPDCKMDDETVVDNKECIVTVNSDLANIAQTSMLPDTEEIVTPASIYLSASTVGAKQDLPEVSTPPASCSSDPDIVRSVNITHQEERKSPYDPNYEVPLPEEFVLSTPPDIPTSQCVVSSSSQLSLNDTSSEISDSRNVAYPTSESSSRHVPDEDKILAGLRFLREKFEQKNNR
ncbi:coiled-coil domain-containing protein 174 [Orussus abietinus]|uniref:coiled-coil domain-containing protein 174 n=1 Tax=Orussus abietinus TaxID=222816 RepID=UPI000625ECD2|nr:coiled-coil domain-containing protein 174 [Orussus abietinus]